jgi:DNA repair protein RecO (recombination protein O)
MPEPVTSEAVCLRSRNWRDSSCILTLLTRELGLISAIAKGARRPKSRLGAPANLFTHSRLLLHPPRSGELFLITEAELLDHFPGLSTSYENLMAASQLAEFLISCLPPRHPEERIFLLLLTYLDRLARLSPETDPPAIRLLILSFLLKALTFLGYRPELDRCARCRQELEPPATFDPRMGALLCKNCTPAAGVTEPQLNADQLQIVRKLLYTPAARLVLPDREIGSLVPEPAIIRTILYFIRHHYPGQQFPLLSQLLQPHK